MTAPHLSRKILWGSGIVRDPPSVAYEEVMNDELALYKWLEKIVSVPSLTLDVMLTACRTASGFVSSPESPLLPKIRRN